LDFSRCKKKYQLFFAFEPLDPEGYKGGGGGEDGPGPDPVLWFPGGAADCGAAAGGNLINQRDCLSLTKIFNVEVRTAFLRNIYLSIYLSSN